jgi:hypothetical protein
MLRKPIIGAEIGDNPDRSRMTGHLQEADIQK